jgi:hypothetical protein
MSEKLQATTEIKDHLKNLEETYDEYATSVDAEFRRYAPGHPRRKEIDIREVEKSHLDLLQCRLNTAIAVSQIHGMQQAAKDNKIFNKILISLNLVIVTSTVVYTWITWQSVKASREANQIQRHLLQNQKSDTPTPAANGLTSPSTPPALPARTK